MLVAKKNVNNFIEQGNTRTHARAMTLSFLRHSLSLSRGSFVSWRHTLPMHAQNVSMHHQQRQNMSVRAVRSILAVSILVQIPRLGVPPTRARGLTAVRSRPCSLIFSYAHGESHARDQIRTWASKISWLSFRQTAHSPRPMPRSL